MTASLPGTTPDMTASLHVLTGCSRGKIQFLGKTTVVGRQELCDFIVADATISRQHARIELRADGYYVEDLHSRNGTTVNGIPIGAAERLADGDIVHLHSTALLFREQPDAGIAVAEPAERAKGRSLEENEPLVSQQIVEAASARLDSADEWLSAEARGLGQLLARLGVSLDIEQVVARILEGMFEIFPQTDRGIVLLLEPGGELEMRAVKVRPTESGGLTFGPLARRAAIHAIANRNLLLYADAATGVPLDSVIDLPIRSTMCAPLLGPTYSPAGAVHLDTADAARPFSQEDLRTMRVAAAVAGLAVEYARAHEIALTDGASGERST